MAGQSLIQVGPPAPPTRSEGKRRSNRLRKGAPCDFGEGRGATCALNQKRRIGLEVARKAQRRIGGHENLGWS